MTHTHTHTLRWAHQCTLRYMRSADNGSHIIVRIYYSPWMSTIHIQNPHMPTILFPLYSSTLPTCLCLGIIIYHVFSFFLSLLFLLSFTLFDFNEASKCKRFNFSKTYIFSLSLVLSSIEFSLLLSGVHRDISLFFFAVVLFCICCRIFSMVHSFSFTSASQWHAIFIHYKALYSVL